MMFDFFYLILFILIEKIFIILTMVTKSIIDIIERAFYGPLALVKDNFQVIFCDELIWSNSEEIRLGNQNSC